MGGDGKTVVRIGTTVVGICTTEVRMSESGSQPSNHMTVYAQA